MSLCGLSKLVMLPLPTLTLLVLLTVLELVGISCCVLFNLLYIYIG